MISREVADELIRRWASVEEAEIRKHWYPASSPFLHEYSGGRYRENRSAPELDEEVLHGAGRAVRVLQVRYPRDYAVLLRYYVNGHQVGVRSKQLMLDRFALVYTPGSFP